MHERLENSSDKNSSRKYFRMTTIPSQLSRFPIRTTDSCSSHPLQYSSAAFDLNKNQFLTICPSLRSLCNQANTLMGAQR